MDKEIEYAAYIKKLSKFTWVDYGPMQMKIMAYQKEHCALDLAAEAGRVAINHLLELIENRSLAEKPWKSIDEFQKMPVSLRKMLFAVKECADLELTPMAAVAGVLADLTADWLSDHGATKVLVDNGGDIAIRLSQGETVRIGISPGVNMPGVIGCIDLDSNDDIGGVATSGMGGKSFTMGIANAVVVFAKTASVADACSTSIANHTCTEHDLIERCPAKLLDPDTDIPDHLIVTGVGNLPEKVIKTALKNGSLRSKSLQNDGKIAGSIIICQGYKVITSPNLHAKLML